MVRVMTRQELNRDAKRLIKVIKSGDFRDDNLEVKEEIVNEFKRIYLADKEFTYLSPVLALKMVRINLSLRVFPLHTFGLNIEL